MICPTCGQSSSLLKPRSAKQNRAYFGIGVKKLADKYNVHKSTMHSALAGAFFGMQDIDFGNGLVIKVPQSTQGRTTEEFIDFYMYVQKIGADNGIDIPDPKEKKPSAPENDTEETK